MSDNAPMTDGGMQNEAPHSCLWKVAAWGRSLALLGLGLLLASVQTRAQGIDLTVTASTNGLLVNTPLLYSITVSNNTANLLPSLLVSNAFSTNVTFVNATNLHGTFATNGATNIVFNITNLPSPGTTQVFLTVLPLYRGQLANRVYLSAPGTGLTNVTTNVVVTVSNTPSVFFNILFVGPLAPVYSNDYVQLGAFVTNTGPSAATNVLVTNTFSSAFKLLSLTPSNQVSLSSTSLVFSLGALTNGQVGSYKLTLQPTNDGPLTSSVSVNAEGFVRITPTNYDTVFLVRPLVPGWLTATVLTPQTLNRQTGLMEQDINLHNNTLADIVSARVIITGLNQWLYNAVGTNDGNPYILYNDMLRAGKNVTLRLEFVVTNRVAFPLADAQLEAYPQIAFTNVISTNSAFALSRPPILLTNPPGAMLIEFQSVPGNTYVINYSPDASFTNSFFAQPPIVAPAERTQWIDDGPPKTISLPDSATSRFYRVLLLNQ